MVSVVIVQDDNSIINELTKVINSSELCTVVGSASNGIDAIKAIDSLNPQIVLMELVLPIMDGFKLLEYYRTNSCTAKFIVLTNLKSATFIDKAIELGASYYMLKPLDNNLLIQRITEYGSDQLIRRPNVSSRDLTSRNLDERISNIFISVGIPAHIKGYQFLREGIKLAVDNPMLINSITKSLYPAIARRFSTTSSKVERAIRHAIEVAWSRGKIENINSLFGVKVYTVNEKPTNGEFIALLADKMLLEGA